MTREQKLKISNALLNEYKPVREPKVIVIKKEAHPLKINGTIFRAYYNDGRALYMGNENPIQLEADVRNHENVAEIIYQ